MSDSEYYEDDWEPVYDDGLGAHADDLAEHSLPSPPYPEYDSETQDLYDNDHYEDAVLEYVDFYYDDDPSVMKKPRRRRRDLDNDGSQQSVTKKRKKGAPERQSSGKTKKRRKESTGKGKDDNDDHDDNDDNDDDDNNTRTESRYSGVIWKTTSATSRPPVYEPGNGEKVSLLADWRALATHPISESTNRLPKFVAKAKKISKRDEATAAASAGGEEEGFSSEEQSPQPPRWTGRDRVPADSSPLKQCLSPTHIPWSSGDCGDRPKSASSDSERQKKKKPPLARGGVIGVLGKRKDLQEDESDEDDDRNSKRQLLTKVDDENKQGSIRKPLGRRVDTGEKSERSRQTQSRNQSQSGKLGS